MRDLPETMEPVFADDKEIAPKGFEFITRESVGNWKGNYYWSWDEKSRGAKWHLVKDKVGGPTWSSGVIYLRPIPEKAEEAKALFSQVAPQTHEEKIAMYMGLPQKYVAEMLINCSTLLESLSGISKAAEAKEVKKPEYRLVEGFTPADLSQYVTEEMSNGWKPNGNPFGIHMAGFFQPMTRNL